MNIRAKIWWSFSALSLVCLALAGTSIYLLTQLATDSRQVMHANHRTLEYCQGMLIALDSLVLTIDAPTKTRLIRQFEQNLALENDNITELGENVLVEQLNDHWATMKTRLDRPANRQDHIRIREICLAIAQLNLEAMKIKNDQANTTTRFTTQTMIAACTLVAVFILTFMVNVPAALSNPLRQLTQGIRAVASGNYNHKLEIHRSDEIGELAEAFNTMVNQLETYRRSTLAELIHEKNRTTGVLNLLSDGFILLDEQERLIFINPIATQALGLSSNTSFIPLSAQELAQQNDLFRKLYTHKSTALQKINVVLNGKTQHFQPEYHRIYGHVHRSGQPEHLGTVIRLVDITSFVELDEAKTQFMATVSHELKTPLSSIHLSLRLLADPRFGKLTADQSDLVTSLQQETDRMVRLTSHVLDVSQLETGTIQLFPQDTVPEALIQQTIDMLANQARQRTIRIEPTIQAHLPMVYVDPDKTTWVLANLLGNAIRYSPENGTINIRAKTEQFTDKVIIEVQDHGPGIPADKQPYLFNRWYKTNDQAKGNGLGLAIAREFTEAQHGTIQVESVEGQGTTFRVILPTRLNQSSTFPSLNLSF
jgi:signal transduction histidine kinase